MESCVPTEQNKTVLTTFNSMKQENFSQKIARNRQEKKKQQQKQPDLHKYLTRTEPEQPDLKNWAID